MTDQTTTPPTEQTLVYNLLQALLVLLGTLGIAVPPLLQQQSVLITIAGGLCALGGAAWSLYSHWAKNDVIQTQAAKLALSAKRPRVVN